MAAAKCGKATDLAAQSCDPQKSSSEERLRNGGTSVCDTRAEAGLQRERRAENIWERLVSPEPLPNMTQTWNQLSLPGQQENFSREMCSTDGQWATTLCQAQSWMPRNLHGNTAKACPHAASALWGRHKPVDLLWGKWQWGREGAVLLAGEQEAERRSEPRGLPREEHLRQTQRAGRIDLDRAARSVSKRGSWCGGGGDGGSEGEGGKGGLRWREGSDHRRIPWFPQLAAFWNHLENLKNCESPLESLIWIFDRYGVWLVISSFKISKRGFNVRMRLGPWSQRSSGLKDTRHSWGSKWGAPLKTGRVRKRWQIPSPSTSFPT